MFLQPHTGQPGRPPYPPSIRRASIDHRVVAAWQCERKQGDPRQISRRHPTKDYIPQAPKTGLPFIFPLLQPIRQTIGHPKASVSVDFGAHFEAN